MYSEPRFSRCPHCPTFITFTNNNPSEGSTDTPPQFPPPSVLGKNNALPSSGNGVYGSPIFIRFASNNSLQNRACSGDRSYMSSRRNAFFASGRRLHGKRLRLRCHFPRHRRLGHRPFFHPVHRLPRHAVEHEQQTHLSDLG